MDPVQSQLLLINSERFGLLLAENLNDVGMSLKIQSENICKSLKFNFYAVINIQPIQ